MDIDKENCSPRILISFFELNPAGQFLWLEDITDLPLAAEMAKFLLGKE